MRLLTLISAYICDRHSFAFADLPQGAQGRYSMGAYTQGVGRIGSTSAIRNQRDHRPLV